MKHRNLEILREHYINVPDFIVVDGKEELDLSFSKEELFAVRSSLRWKIMMRTVLQDSLILFKYKQKGCFFLY